jgi:uncharacterized delta-60 repeat protein
MRGRGATCGRINRALLAASAVLAVAVPSAQAHPGALDLSFGEGGRAATAADLGSSWKKAAVDIAIADDGEAVVVSERQLFRYLPDGQLDPSFGRGGTVTLETVEGLSFKFADVAVDSEGRTVAFGSAVDPGTKIRVPFYWTGGTVQPTFAVVLRFDPSGRLDPSFGGGDGIIRTDLGLRSIQYVEGGAPPPPLIRAVAGDIDPQGRPVLVASLEEVIPCKIHCSYLAWSGRVVARLTADGSLDTSFNGVGFTLLGNTANRNLAVDPASGSLLVAGSRGLAGSEATATQVTWLDDSGAIDAGYGTAGVKMIAGRSAAAALDRFGRLLLLASPGAGRSHVVRLLPNGQLDPSFGRGGRARVRLPGKGSSISALAVDARGRVVLIGTSGASEADESGAGPSRFTLVGRLRNSGPPDLSFGHRGWVRTGFGAHTKLAAAHDSLSPEVRGTYGPHAALDAHGRLVVVATAHSPQMNPSGIVLARYLSSP